MPSAVVRSRREKLLFVAVMALAAGAALWVMLRFPPREQGVWPFTRTAVPFQYLAGAALLIASAYVMALAFWYRGSEFHTRLALAAMFCGGAVSILWSLALHRVFMHVALLRVESGWWLFKRVEVTYANPVYAFLSRTAAVAGLVEEPAKLLAVVCVWPVCRAIKDRASGILYVSLCAFGFALIENVLYFHQSEQVLWLRANPGHAVFSALWGGAFGAWRGGKGSFVRFLLMLVLGVALHAVWNISASVHYGLFLAVFAATVVLGLTFVRRGLNPKAKKKKRTRAKARA